MEMKIKSTQIIFRDFMAIAITNAIKYNNNKFIGIKKLFIIYAFSGYFMPS